MAKPNTTPPSAASPPPAPVAPATPDLDAHAAATDQAAAGEPSPSPDRDDIARLFGLAPEMILDWRYGGDELVVVTIAGRKLRRREGSAEVEEPA